LQGGSRFNIRYEPRIPSDALTPQGVMSALTQYVAFAPEMLGASETLPPGASVREQGEPSPTDSTGHGDPASSLRKGMARQTVISLLGEPNKVTDREQGGLKIVTCTFERKDATIIAEFVSDILIRYTVSSK
jgi:hypothetical protein